MSMRIAVALVATIGAAGLMSSAAEARGEIVGISGEYTPGTIVVKTDVLNKHPWIARALYEAFSAAKYGYVERLERGQDETDNDKRYRSLMPLVGDPLPYGMKANRASIEALMTYALQQPLEQAFVDPEA